MESINVTREEVEHFLSIGQSYPMIYGSGFGDSSGYGRGSGFGSGSISGFGYGYGYGSGCGNEYGYGRGYDSDSGEGEDGYGYGNGDIPILNGNIVDDVDSIPTIIIQVKDNFAKGYIVKEDLTLESCYIAKVGNSFAHGKTLKEAFTDAGRKEMKNTPIKERIKKFVEVFGSLDSEHAGKEYYNWHNILTGSCQMGRDGFCKAHDIDLEKKYTVRYFLDITKDSYGGHVIRQIIDAYFYQD